MPDNKNLAKYLANLSQANLILQSKKRLDDNMDKLVKMGEKFDSEEEIGQVQRGTAIALTAGDKEANKQLITYINNLIAYKRKNYVLAKLLHKKKTQVLMAFNIAMGSHFANWEDLIQSSILKGIEKNMIFDSNHMIPAELIPHIKKIQQLDDKSDI